MQPQTHIVNQEKSYHHGTLAAFMARKIEIDAMLQQLTELSANHFVVDPEGVDWRCRGTLGHDYQLLRQVCNSAFQEGDYAA